MDNEAQSEWMRRFKQVYLDNCAKNGKISKMKILKVINTIKTAKSTHKGQPIDQQRSGKQKLLEFGQHEGIPVKLQYINIHKKFTKRQDKLRQLSILEWSKGLKIYLQEKIVETKGLAM